MEVHFTPEQEAQRSALALDDGAYLEEVAAEEPL
jgi:hypothetical protein